MLKFEALELVGFKSFADKTRVVFDDRITAVIGPNGCGKSNLFDAIGWVLGAQNARNLRGEKMEDVIFNGTGKRKMSGMARVSLRVRKSDDQPLTINGRSFEGDTLEISRKLYRDGRSLYLLNDRRCRLKDVQEAMESVGLGFATYALIAQGSMESILTGKPLDRRAVIEEAAQIINYRSKRRSAELKLELARQNLVRVNDIVSEVERSLRSLKRQASKARRYRKLQTEFREAQLLKFALQAREVRTGLLDCRSELGTLATTRQDLETRFESAQQAYRKSARERDSLEESLETLQEDHSRQVLAKDRTRNAIKFSQEQLESSGRSLKNNGTEQEAIKKSLEKVQDELRAFAFEKNQLEVEEARIKKAVEEQTRLFGECSRDRKQAEDRIEELRNQLLKLSAETTSLGNLKDQLEQRMQGFTGQRERLLRDEARYRLELKEAVGALERSEKAVEAKRTQLSQTREQLDQNTERLRQFEDRLEQMRLQETETGNQLIALKERLQSLQEVEINHSQYSEGVQKLLNHLNQSSAVRTSGTLADRIETSPEFERLMEEFLDKELEYVLVDSMDEALLGLSEVKTLDGGKCTFLSIRSNNGFGKSNGRQILEPQGPGVFGTVGSLLQMDPEVEDAFQRVLPQRADAIVVSDLDRAFQLAHTYPENTFITMGGEALTPRGLLASTTTGTGKLGLLGLKRQKKLLEKKVRDRKKKQVHQQQEMASVQAAAEKSKLDCESKRNVLYQLEKDIISLSHQKEQGQNEVRHTERALRVLSDELAQLEAEEARLKDRIEDVAGQRSEAERRRTEAEASLAETQHSLQRLRLESQRMQEQLHQVASDQKVLEERRASLGRTLARVEEQGAGLRTRLSAALDAEQEARDRIERLESELEEMKSRVEMLDQREMKAAAALNRCRQEHQQWKEAFPAIEEELQVLQDQKNEHQDKHALLEVEQAKFETQLQNISQQCREQSNLSLDQALSELDSSEVPPLEEVLERYDRLKVRMDTFGPINMTALEEYQESEERHGFLVKQRQDIESSIQDTLQAIQRLNRRSREKFKEAFEAVNRNFQEVFQKLFGGGECGMRLLDEDDLLESGVDIYARPPGKKLQNVMLLSGGEKALTVLALLVGLFTYRPSRFCILDEVDAPLDDANVTRFNNLMRDMSQHTQMILVTHNKLTMENTDSIFGVTMAEPGISQVVSVKF